VLTFCFLRQLWLGVGEAIAGALSYLGVPLAIQALLALPLSQAGACFKYRMLQRELLILQRFSGSLFGAPIALNATLDNAALVLRLTFYLELGPQLVDEIRLRFVRLSSSLGRDRLRQPKPGRENKVTKTPRS